MLSHYILWLPTLVQEEPKILKEAITKVPAVKYALGIAGVAAATSLVIGFLRDYRVAVFGPIIMLFLMVVLAIFARNEKSPHTFSWSPASVLTWSSLVLTIATGTFLLTTFFFSWPRSIDTYFESKVDPVKINEMTTSLNMGYYDIAERYANDILNKDKKNSKALSVKACVAFYKGDYRNAVHFFSAARDADPSHTTYTRNLALSYTELGFYDKAIELFKSIQDETEDWSYETGRVYLYADRYNEALKLLQTVSTSFKGGRARILEAAALAGIAREEGDANRKGELLNRARTALAEGRKTNPAYWNDKLYSGVKDVHENYTKAKQLLEDLL